MESCEYCGASFDDEEGLLDHLAAEHRGELGPIDQRRVASHEGGSERDLPTGPLVLGIVIVGSVLLVAFVIFGMGGGGGGTTVNGIAVAQAPGNLQSGHAHGTINATIDGQRLDFSEPRWQGLDRRFHFEPMRSQALERRVWHTHAEGVTLEYAMATLDIAVNESSVTYEGTTYTDGENADVIVRVDGDAVDPASYVLEGVGDPQRADQGDHVRIVVRQTG